MEVFVCVCGGGGQKCVWATLCPLSLTAFLQHGPFWMEDAACFPRYSWFFWDTPGGPPVSLAVLQSGSGTFHIWCVKGQLLPDCVHPLLTLTSTCAFLKGGGFTRASWQPARV